MVLCRKWKKTKAYAAKMPVASLKTVTRPAMENVFVRILAKGTTSKTRL